MSYTKGVARDLSEKLQRRIAEVLERELQIASHVVEMPEIAAMLMEASIMMIRTSAATLANSCQESALDEVYNASYDAIVAAAVSAKPEGLHKARVKIAESRR
jgi:hypothetical protein